MGYLFWGLYLFYECGWFGAMLKNPQAWVWYPVLASVCRFAEWIGCVPVFWGALFAWPFIALFLCAKGLHVLITGGSPIDDILTLAGIVERGLEQDGTRERPISVKPVSEPYSV